MLALLFEEAVTVAGLHEGSSSLISGGLGLIGGYDRDGECHQLATCVQSCWLRSANARWGDTSQDINIRRSQAPGDASAAVIKGGVNFLCMG